MPVVQEYGKQRIEYSIKLKSLFDRSSFATNVVIKISVPNNTANCKVYASGIGKAKYEPEKHALMWRIKKVHWDAEYVLTAEVSLTPTKSDKVWIKPPINMEF